MDKNMGKSPMEESGAGDESAGGDQMGASSMVTIPADLMPGCKAGDTYTVKSMDGDNVMLEADSMGDSGSKWGDDLVKHVTGGQDE
jgi:hypothetical protein